MMGSLETRHDGMSRDMFQPAECTSIVLVVKSMSGS